MRASGCTGEPPPDALSPASGVVTPAGSLGSGDTVTPSRGGTAELPLRAGDTSPPKMDFRAGTIHHPLLLYLFGVGLEELLLLTALSVLRRDEMGMKTWEWAGETIHHLPVSIPGSTCTTPQQGKAKEPGQGV